MRKISALFILLLTACVPQYQSPHDQIVQKCNEAGYKDKELGDCISIATATYNKGLEKQEKENAKEFERQRKEAIKAQKEAKQRQLNADGAICKDYGFKKGTKDFASCMMQIEVSRQQAQQQQQIANQQIEANRRTAEMQMQQNYAFQRQQQQQNYEAQMQQNYQMQMQALTANRPVILGNQNKQTNCTSRIVGDQLNTNCY